MLLAFYQMRVLNSARFVSGGGAGCFVDRRLIVPRDRVWSEGDVIYGSNYRQTLRLTQDCVFRCASVQV